MKTGRDGVVDVLLSKGADADFQETKSGKTALHIASELGMLYFEFLAFFRAI